jgi:hypothetical protein
MATRQGLERDQVPDRRDRHEDVRQYLQPVGPADDLVFDAGIREKQVDESAGCGCLRSHQSRRRQPVHVVLLDERRERIAPDLQAVDDAFRFRIVRDGDGEIDILSEAGLCTERHRQAADDGPPRGNGVEIRSGLPEDCVDGLHPALPAGRQPQAIGRLAARPAEPRLYPGLDLLIRGQGVLAPHALPVHPHPGVAHVEDHPELLNISNGHDSILGGVEPSGRRGQADGAEVRENRLA